MQQMWSSPCAPFRKTEEVLITLLYSTTLCEWKIGRLFAKPGSKLETNVALRLKILPSFVMVTGELVSPQRPIVRIDTYISYGDSMIRGFSHRDRASSLA